MGDPGLEIVGNHLGRHAPQELEQANVGGQPVILFLRPGRVHKDQARRRQAGHEQLRLTNRAVDRDRGGVTGIIHLHRLARTVGLVHRQSKPGLFAPLRVVMLELRQAEPVRMCGLVLHPHQLEGEVAVAPQVQVDLCPVRLRAVTGQRLRRKQRRLQHVVRQALGHRGVNPGRRRPLQVFAHRRPSHAGSSRNRADIVAQRNT